MGGNKSKPVTNNTQGLMVSQSEMATFNIHNDTLSLVLSAVAGTIIIIIIIYLIRKYRKRTQESRPIRAATTLHQMEMASIGGMGGYPARQMPFLFGKPLPQLPMLFGPQQPAPQQQIHQPGHQPQPPAVATIAPSVQPIHLPTVAPPPQPQQQFSKE